MSRHRKSSRGRSIKLAAVAAALSVTAAAVVPADAAAAPVSDDSGTGDTALITPLLRILNFGATVGLPLACSAASSLLPAFESQLSDLSNELADQCSKLSSMGGNYLAQAIQQSSALQLVNPVLNPLIAQFSQQVGQTGKDQAAALSPFGPTIAGLGGTIAFFEGSTN